ncbi:MAG: nucleotidyl transferase AbiEii/AbiGii toxin family protein [Bacteroidota bacterium]
MIAAREINAISGKLKVRDTQIEKDYIITWVLNGIANQAYLKEHLLFKGGTALKKIYYLDYRFSEDLDFTFYSGTFNKDAILDAFREVFEWIYEESRIKLSIKTITQHSTGNINFYIGYIGSLGGDGSKKDLKVDISQNEIICYPVEERVVQSSYSDCEEEYSIHCYSLSEIIAEKMRTLMERTTPRDLYDLWYQLEVEDQDIEDYIFGFQEKAAYKKLDTSKFIEQVNKKQATLKKQWEKFLAHQINDLPDFDGVWRDFGRHLRKYAKFVASS